MRQRTIPILIAISLWACAAVAQERLLPRSSARVILDGRFGTVRLAQHFTTTIRLPEPVNSVVVGDPGLFQAEHSPNEPLLVFVRPTSSAGESNLVVSTASGRQFVMLLQHSAEGFDPLVVCRVSGSAFIEETYPTSLIAETVAFGGPREEGRRDHDPAVDPLTTLLDQQRSRHQNAPVGEGLKVNVGRVLEQDSRFVVLFSVVNDSGQPVELMPPQVQLAGQVKSGLFGHSAKWTTVEQIPVEEFRLTGRKLSGGSRADGLVVFERPSLKQSNESLVLQIAEASRVDRPVLVPISFSAEQSVEVKK